MTATGIAANKGRPHREGHIGIEWKGLLLDPTAEQMARPEQEIEPPEFVVARLPPDFERNGIIQQIGDHGTMMTLWKDPLLDFEAWPGWKNRKLIERQAAEVAKRTAAELRRLLEPPEKARSIRPSPRRRGAVSLASNDTSTPMSPLDARDRRSPSLLGANTATSSDEPLQREDPTSRSVDPEPKVDHTRRPDPRPDLAI